jgi:flagellar hook-length control protein FliK
VSGPQSSVTNQDAVIAAIVEANVPNQPVRLDASASPASPIVTPAAAMLQAAQPEAAGNARPIPGEDSQNESPSPSPLPEGNDEQSRGSSRRAMRPAAARVDAEIQSRPARTTNVAANASIDRPDPQPSAAALPQSAAGRDATAADGRSAASAPAPPIDLPIAEQSPAASRAAAVEAAVKLELATGDASAREVQQPVRAAVPASAGDALRTVLDAEPARVPARDAADDPAAERLNARIARGLSAMVNQRGGVMLMRLDPPELGPLRVQMTIANGTVTAQFEAATSEARALLDRNMAVLRTALESHGLSVERLSVHAPQPLFTLASRDDASAQQHAGQQRHDADAGGSESRGRRDEHARQDRADRQPDSTYADIAQRAGDPDPPRTRQPALVR